ncbi:hypothetical protein [Paraburkholderia dilworthii]|uniref:hypothetical protein n=1 Tax=Paraburkholderia dilworthii TaxID=948106 RepID=UPI0004145CFB|nr:hypothetical protein [Paraburkholderia dilworthii]
MLSPHEFAALMLVRSAPDRIDLNGTDLETLVERQLVVLEPLASGRQRLSLTLDGDLLLQAVARNR